ncbi:MULTISPECIES: TetR/AcrR family transcriptional regulator [Streptacidiphilus]|uniref:TetR/AcrR family transcriptional regulator n=1 Tax=Streptacidiphilus cavernicola TaxID=3342716 RepID=A0ABV6ULT7_9ACTN|nr:TetR/AcrR family transcriptional regulator [Streptacidiphilus jeojiense]
MIESAIPEQANDIAARIARRSLAKQEADHASDVRRLLDAAYEVITRCGTESRPRVADIVAAAGLSNDAFYRYFRSKDALVAALLLHGTEQLVSYTVHQMGKETTPAGRVRRWVEAVFCQTREDMAAATRALLWNGSNLGDGPASARYAHVAPLAALLHGPYAELGSADPEMDASLTTHAVLGKISDYVFRHVVPTRAELDRIVGFTLRAGGGAVLELGAGERE